MTAETCMCLHAPVTAYTLVLHLTDVEGGRHHSTMSVGTLEDAKAEHDAAVDRLSVLSSGHLAAEVLEDGRLVARISYNGRLWAPDGRELKRGLLAA